MTGVPGIRATLKFCLTLRIVCKMLLAVKPAVFVVGVAPPAIISIAPNCKTRVKPSALVE